MSQQQPLYERDPVAWQKYLAQGNAKPRKRVGCDVLVRDTSGRILIVNPEYKPDWDLPCGMAEANESPVEAVHRELREELGNAKSASFEHQGPGLRPSVGACSRFAADPRLSRGFSSPCSALLERPR
jgi:8-oxo-dGTP pyrophosphatase MutT (NUDIX family)